MNTANEQRAQTLFFRAAAEGSHLRAAVAADQQGLFNGLSRPRAVVLLVEDRRGELAAQAVITLASDAKCPVVYADRLPEYVGALDLVICALSNPDSALGPDLAEASRRGAQTVLIDPGEGPVRAAVASDTIVVARPAFTEPSSFCGYLGVFVSVLAAASVSNIAPAAIVAEVADAVDQELAACAPQRDITVNPAKQTAAWLTGRRKAWAGDGPLWNAMAGLGALLAVEAGYISHASGMKELLSSLPALIAVENEAAEGAGGSVQHDIFYDPYIDGESEGPQVLPLGAVLLASPDQFPALREQFDSAAWARIECPALDVNAHHPLITVCVTAARIAAIAAYLVEMEV